MCERLTYFPPRSKVLATVDACRNGGLTDGSADIAQRPGFDALFGTCAAAALPDTPADNLCRAAIEGYAQDCDGEECCFAQSMKGWDQLWADCVTNQARTAPRWPSS